jgi:hypothetical protein
MFSSAASTLGMKSGAATAVAPPTLHERYLKLMESYQKHRKKRDDKDILFFNAITDVGQKEASAINKTYEEKALALKEASADNESMFRGLLKDRKTRSDAADADNNEAMRGLVATFTPTRKTQGDRRRLVFDDTEKEEVVQEEGDEEVFQDVNEDLDEVAEVEEEEEEQVEEEEEYEEEEYEALMALTNDKDFMARVTVDVISHMQHDNLIRVFIKFVDFDKKEWPKKEVLVAFLAQFNVHPPRTGATKRDLVDLVKDVLGKNS